MKSIKSILASALTIAAMQAGATPVTVDGVTFVPGSFSAGSNLYQWFTSAPVAQGGNPTYNGTVVAPGTPGSTLEGIGIITQVNNTFSSGFLQSGGQLTYTFGGFTVSGGGFTGGWLNVYYNPTFVYTPFNASPLTLPSGANAGSLWLSLTAQSDQFTAFGGWNAGQLLAYFDVTGGAAAGNFAPQMIFDFINSTDVNAKSTGTAFFGDLGGTLGTGTDTVVGNTIPEPETLVLVGVSLLGLGLAGRAKKRN
ncbi:MAG: PEP-CTERM sorting domain-containing protein [Paucibacter sp.]|nr:PEP-CTERM sorting domain-containing protein [Roseateles sp.]